MDSSTIADYQFMVSDDPTEKKYCTNPASGGCTTKYVIIGVILAAILVSAVVIGIIVAIAVTTETSTPTATQQGLVNTYVTNDNFTSEYYGSDGTGIHITGTIQGNMFILNITTTDGDHSVMYIMHSMAMNMTMVGVEDTNFMIMENRPGRPRYDDYIVPMSAMNETMSIMRGEEMMSDDVLREYDNTTVNQTRQTMLYNLAMSDKAVLIIEAALALGETGIEGSEYNVVMRFYQLALRIQTIRGTVMDDIEQPTPEDDASPNESRRKRAVRCSSNGHYCHPSVCPTGSECFGQCGYGCWCWRFVCGSCCVHEYCRSHDQCCANAGFWSWACFRVGWDVHFSQCHHTYQC